MYFKQPTRRLCPPANLVSGTASKSVICLSVLLSGSGLVAQESQSQADSGDEKQTVERIVVTGSRIARTGAQMSLPATTITSETIKNFGSTNVADIIRELPALGQGINASSSNSAGAADPSQGLNLLDLRRLGVERTLVLVNGRRHVGSQPGNTAVDVSSIPIALVDRVEAVTGGAGAVYGADAVSGAINIILKERFEGIQVDVQNGITEQGDGFEQDYSVTAGTNFSEDRGNVTFHLGYNDRNNIEGKDRDFAQTDTSFVPNPNNTGPNDGEPASITIEDRTFTFPAPGGADWGIVE